MNREGLTPGDEKSPLPPFSKGGFSYQSAITRLFFAILSVAQELSYEAVEMPGCAALRSE
jgi:hypothetical protein